MMFHKFTHNYSPKVRGFMEDPKFGEDVRTMVAMAVHDLAAIEAFFATRDKDWLQKLSEEFGPDMRKANPNVTACFGKLELAEKTHRATAQFLVNNDPSPEVVVEIIFYMKEGSFEDELAWNPRGGLIEVSLVYHAGKRDRWADSSWRYKKPQ
jgi:hypothetical protein